MRKQIVRFFAIAVMLFMPLGVAAETTTISTVVPEPSYQMTIPADIQMEYKASSCTIDAPFINQSSGFSERAYMTVSVSYSGAFSSQSTTTTIPFALYAKADSGTSEWVSGDKLVYDRMEDGSVNPTGHMSDGKVPSAFELQITNDAWEKANPGTYTAAITFTAQPAFSE